MTEQEATRILNEIRTENPQKIVGQRMYRIVTARQRRGEPNCVEVYRLTASGARAIFDHVTTLDDPLVHPDVRAWLDSRR